MSLDLIVVFVILIAAWVWATWPFTRETYRITANALEGLGEWIANEIFDKEDSIGFHELRCERCGELIGSQKQRILVEQNRLWWTCGSCHASNCVEIVGVTSYD